MKPVWIRVPAGASMSRIGEAVRVAAGLSQQPGLLVSLSLPPLPESVPSSHLREHLVLFSEKGAKLHADSSWEKLLPPGAARIRPTGPSEPVSTGVHLPF